MPPILFITIEKCSCSHILFENLSVINCGVIIDSSKFLEECALLVELILCACLGACLTRSWGTCDALLGGTRAPGHVGARAHASARLPQSYPCMRLGGTRAPVRTPRALLPMRAPGRHTLWGTRSWVCAPRLSRARASSAFALADGSNFFNACTRYSKILQN